MRTDDPLLRYQVMEPLGAGRQGRTYVAIDRQTHQRVAVKVLDLGSTKDWKSFERFEREIATLKTLDHPGIPKYLDSYASEQTGEYFLVMSLVAGRPLSEYLRGPKRLTDAQLLSVLEQVLATLAYLHDRTPAIVHRDIKPANMVMRDDGSVCLIDFGGVRRAADPDAAPTVVGTFGYMAPEQAQGQATPGSDVYALGVTIATLASNLDPEELPREGLALRLPHDVLRTPWRDVVQQMLAPDPRQRYADATVAQAALREATRRSLGASKTTADLEPTGADDVELASTIRELQNAPRPLLAVVWVLASFVAGALFVVEAAFLPLVYSLIGAFSENNDKARLATSQRDAEARLRSYRKQLAALSRSAEVVRDERNGRER